MTSFFSENIAGDPALEFALTIRDLDLALSRRAAPDLADLNLSRAQIPVLATIAERPGSTGGEIADAIFTSPQAASQVLARLVDIGYVRREALGGRAMGHHLTDQGAIAVWLARERFSAMNRRFLAVLGEDEAREMTAAMRRVLHAMTDETR